MGKIQAVVLGYGNRGASYSDYAVKHPDELEIVAVADPIANRLQYAAQLHSLPEDRIFTDWRQIADRQTTQVPIDTIGNSISSGHGGGDVGIMIDAVNYFGNGIASPSVCDIRMSYLSHLIAFAAEESRLTGTVVDLEEYSARW